MNELERCKLFLIRNGWRINGIPPYNTLVNDEKQLRVELFPSNPTNYYLCANIPHGPKACSHCRPVEIPKNEIHLFCNDDEIVKIPMNYFALVGALIEYRQIGFNYLTAR